MYASEFSNVLYAVIEVKWLGRPAERFALAYQSEECLRDVIAAPSIIASGFFSRQDALAILEDKFGGSDQKPAALISATYNSDARTAATRGQPGWQERLGLKRVRTAARQFLRQLPALFIIVVFSKGIFSTALRAFMTN